MLPLTTGHILDSWARLTPERVAVIDAATDTAWSYRDLAHACDRTAARLHALGVKTGDVVAYVSDERLNTVALWYALGKLGASWCPLNPRATVDDWLQQITHAEASLVLYSGSFEPSVKPLPIRSANLGPSPLDDPDPVSWPVTAHWPDRAGILYTSGTTGSPKGAWHSHRSLWGWNTSVLSSLGIGGSDRFLNPYPLYHMGGIGFTLAAIQAGATTVLATPFDAQATIEYVPRYDITVTIMVPTMVQALLEQSAPERQTLLNGHWRHLVTTSAPLLEDTRQGIHREWPTVRLSVLYSATEAVFTVASDHHGPSSLMVGRPAFGMDIRIRTEDGRPAAPGQTGTIYTRGISLFEGYHRAPDQFHAIDRGWLTCFDTGYLTADGDLVLVDRAADLINSGGEKISSLEIENILLSHPAIKEAGVVGLPDPYWGERIHAVIVPRIPDLHESDLYPYLTQHLPRYKWPKSWAFVPELPKTGSGKILKRALRQENSRGR